MEEKTVVLPAINCSHCVGAIRREIGALEGITAVEGDAGTKRVTVRWQPPLNWEQIREKLVRLGYPPEA